MFPQVISEPSADHRTTLLAIRPRQCRFIVSEDVRDAICCGAPTPESSSWCNWHREIVYMPRHSEKDRRRAA
jgi:hypothetical protein